MGSARPKQWRGLLEARPGLRVNLGHFGGAHRAMSKYTWTKQIAAAMKDHEGLFADVGCQQIDTLLQRSVHMAVIRNLHEEGFPILQRVMFGTDWYMQAINKNYHRFVSEYRSLWGKHFGDEAVGRFMSSNALTFLGF